jgi:uncharacterized membrane protein
MVSTARKNTVIFSKVAITIIFKFNLKITRIFSFNQGLIYFICKIRSAAMDYFDAYFMEWGNLMLRWLHIVTAIAWIGSSFFFMHLDASLQKAPDIEKGGEAWQVHGGGFYHMRKFLVAPSQMPEHLTWHKWQSYWTWISGFTLLCWIYYAQASLYLIDPAVQELSTAQAVGIGLFGLSAGWVAYDYLCKSPLGKHELWLSVAGFFYIILTAYAFSLVFSPRGALIHTGAVMATMMSANVFLRIIPNTRKSVAALTKGEAPDPAWGKEAKQRSTHNNYITLPVIFMMITNHYPLTYASQAALPLLTAFVLIAGGVVRYFYNILHSGQKPPYWAWFLAFVMMMCAAYLSVLASPLKRKEKTAQMLSEQVPNGIVTLVQGRCAMCHAEVPVWEGIKIAPKGILLDTAGHILKNKPLIKVHSVMSHAMPPNNLTLLDAQDRAMLEAWVRSK